MTYYLETSIINGDTFERCFSSSLDETRKKATIEIAHETASERKARTHAIVGYAVPDGVDYYDWISDMPEAPDADYYEVLDA